MSAALESTDRPMFGGQIVRERLAMDEPTIDCWCSAHGEYDVELQVLDRHADWQPCFTACRCREHLPLILDSMVDALSEHSRVVVHRR